MTDQPPKPRRRWFQFSLRTLLIAVTLVAGLLVAWRAYDTPYRRQRETMALIKELGGSYETEMGAPQWLARLFGADNFQDIISVNLSSFPSVVTQEFSVTEIGRGKLVAFAVATLAAFALFLIFGGFATSFAFGIFHALKKGHIHHGGGAERCEFREQPFAFIFRLALLCFWFCVWLPVALFWFCASLALAFGVLTNRIP